jgi:hypothetical protein
VQVWSVFLDMDDREILRKREKEEKKKRVLHKFNNLSRGKKKAEKKKGN